MVSCYLILLEQNIDQFFPATKEHYLGRAPNTGGMYRLLESEYSLIIADLKLSNLGWQAWWQRLHGRCNDIYSADALKKPEQESEQVPEQRSEQKAQQQKKDPKKALHAEPESQVFSYSSGTPPPPPYAP